MQSESHESNHLLSLKPQLYSSASFPRRGRRLARGALSEDVFEEPTLGSSSLSVRSLPINTDAQDMPPSISSLRDATDKTTGRALPFPSFPASISLRLVNSGSVARDHLASERTFLAYVRTSLAIASSGVALVQLFTISPPMVDPAVKSVQKLARPLGAACVGLGLLVLAMGLMRYFAIQRALVNGDFPVARIVVGLLVLCLGTLIILTFSIVIAYK